MAETNIVHHHFQKQSTLYISQATITWNAWKNHYAFFNFLYVKIYID